MKSISELSPGSYRHEIVSNKFCAPILLFQFTFRKSFFFARFAILICLIWAVNPLRKCWGFFHHFVSFFYFPPPHDFMGGGSLENWNEDGVKLLKYFKFIAVPFWRMIKWKKSRKAHLIKLIIYFCFWIPFSNVYSILRLSLHSEKILYLWIASMSWSPENEQPRIVCRAVYVQFLWATWRNQNA